MSSKFKVALVQNCAAGDMAANVTAASDLVRRAAESGPALIALPEHVSYMDSRTENWHAHALPVAEHPAYHAFQALAREVGAWLLVGSLPVRSDDGRIANCSFLFDDKGARVAHYEKIHMFDVDLPTGERFRESQDFQPGAAARLAETPWGMLGMTICYDLRFAALYRALAQAGAEFVSVPSAFIKVTGAAHWHLLLRARAIENGCFVIAPCQVGHHYGKRHSFGHSLVVDPWGEVLADGGEEVGFVTAEIDPARVAEVRAMIPSLEHDRPFSPPDRARPRISAVS